MTYEEYKGQISIIQVAVMLGYKLDRAKGLNQPSFVLTDSTNNVTDRIYIKNPNDSSIQGFWRRNLLDDNSSTTGDLIHFVREHLSSFPVASSARNEVDAINRVLQHIVKSEEKFDVEEYIKSVDNSGKEFSLDDYEREFDNISLVNNILEKRGISPEVVELFMPFVEILRYKNSQYNFKNIGFPYRIAGEETIRGYEIRGISGFKGAAVGTDKNAGWIADFCKDVTLPKFIIFAESAYDLMSFYQLNRHKIKLEELVFFSTGGAFSNDQVRKALECYWSAAPIFCFDNDPNGRMFDVRAISLIYGKELKASICSEGFKFSLDGNTFTLRENFSTSEFVKSAKIKRTKGDFYIMKAPDGLKDWNEVLRPKESLGDEKSRYDCNSKLRR